MDQFGDAIGWPAKDPAWISKIVVMGLISLIPVAGAIALLGWMLSCLDHLRAGRQDLPPAGFDHFGRGLRLFAVQLVYALGIGLAFGVLFAAGLAMTSYGSQPGAAGALAPSGVLVLMLGWAVVLLGALGLYLLLPAIVLRTDRHGIAGGLDVAGVVRLAAARPSLTLMAGLMTLLAYVIGSLGSFLCGIGYFLTIAYGYAMLAGIVRVYEQQIGAPDLPPVQPPAAPA